MSDWLAVKNTLKELLCPAGDGVFAVTSKNSIKHDLQKKIYSVQPEKVKEIWMEKLSSPPNNTCLLGIASDVGGGILRGTNWGPLYLRKKLYDIHQDIYDLGDIRVIPQLLLDDYLKNSIIKKCREALYLDQEIQYPVSPLSITKLVVEMLYRYNKSLKILSLGGDHSISYPLVLNYLETKQLNNDNIGVVHFDAHTDLLESRLGLPVTFGSWVYHVLPKIKNKARFVQIGIRATNHPKEYWENKYGIKQFWAQEIIDRKIQNQHIIEYLKRVGIKQLYISFDIDAIDEKYAGATGTAESKGLLPDMTYELLQELISNFDVTGADLVEVAPFISVPKYDQTMKISQKILSILYKGMM